MEHIIVITSYPEKNSTHSNKTVGGASYTKALITQIKRGNPKSKITVFAEILDKKDSYYEDSIKVERTWKRGNVLSILKTFFYLYRYPSKKIIISFEAYMFGNPFHTIFALFSLFILKLLGKKNYLLLHQIIEDFSFLENNFLKVFILNTLKNVLYKFMILSNHVIVVFEERFKKVLNNPKNVIYIPHLIPKPNIKDKKEARFYLNLDQKKFYVLYFGFIAPYKGVDLLINNWPKIEGVKLIIVGGLNPNHIKNKKHTKFYKGVIKSAQGQQIITSGFIKEEEIPYYFSAVDAVVLPYRTFFSSSGPLSLALAYEKGILLSEALSSYKESNDFQKALEKSHLKINDIVFSFDKKDLKEKISWNLKNIEKIKQFTKLLKKDRSKESVAYQFTNYLFNAHEKN